MRYAHIVANNLGFTELARQNRETAKIERQNADQFADARAECLKNAAALERSADLLEQMASDSYSPPDTVMDGESVRKIAALVQAQVDPAPSEAPVQQAAE